MAIGKFSGSSYIKHYHAGVCDKPCKPVDIDVIVISLATGRRQA